MTLSSPQVSAGPLDFVDIFVRGARSKIYKAFKMTTEALFPRKTGPHLKYSVVRILRITVIIQPFYILRNPWCKNRFKLSSGRAVARALPS